MTAAALKTTRPSSLPKAVVDTGTMTGRHLRRLTRVPSLIAFATLQPVLLVLLFTYGFGGAIDPRGVSRYIDYLLPGLLVLAIGFGASQTGVAVAEDLGSGMIDRFRALPVGGIPVLAGRAAADVVRNLLVTGLMIAVATSIGFRFHGGPAAAIAVVALAAATGLAFSWLNIALGLLVRDPESAGLAGLFPLIILVFASSTLVPVATMPGWLQVFAKVNPVTVIADALRVLCLGGPAAGPVGQALAWIAGLLLVTVTLANRRYRHMGSA